MKTSHLHATRKGPQQTTSSQKDMKTSQLHATRKGPQQTTSSQTDIKTSQLHAIRKGPHQTTFSQINIKTSQLHAIRKGQTTCSQKDIIHAFSRQARRADNTSALGGRARGGAPYRRSARFYPRQVKLARTPSLARLAIM
jgi:hypothetical protein